MKIFSFTLFLVLFSYFNNSFAAKFSYDCGGTEPFWALKITEDQARFSSPSHPDGLQIKIDKGPSFEGMHAEFGGFHNLQLQEENGHFVLYKNQCSDLMSESLYEYSIFIKLKSLGLGKAIYGCCNRINTYQVTKVESNDTLNVREQPKVKSNIIYKLPHNFIGIGVKKCKKSGWCKVEFSRTYKGWVKKNFIRKYKP